MIFVVVIGGIYVGVFTPTEGAAVGAISTGLLAAAHRRLGWNEFVSCLRGTASATGMIFIILLGADLLNAFFALTQMPARQPT